MRQATFRDPIGVDEESAALQLEIARILVNAPSLPIELRAFDLTLLGVTVNRRALELVVGKSSPISKLRLVAKNGAVDVSIVEVHRDTSRFQNQLTTMQQRLRATITSEKFERALVPARKLEGIPVGVPLAFYRQLVPGTDGQALVRTGFNCNQDCGICWQDRTWGRYGAEQVLIWIEDLRRAGACRLIISGGEPTLDARLADYIGYARDLGFEAVTLETNAIQFSKAPLATRLREAGLHDCFVSLHSGDAATSDAITRAPGTFARTIAGIHALLDAEVPVRLNCVMTGEGIEHLEGLPDFIASTFGAHPYLRGLMLSQPTDPFDPALLPAIAPQPRRLREVLAKVIDRAFALGVPVSGLDGPCGPPLCAFAADRRITALRPISESLDGRTYLPACASCGVRHACFGVRIADAKLYGDECVQPLPAPALAQTSDATTDNSR